MFALLVCPVWLFVIYTYEKRLGPTVLCPVIISQSMSCLDVRSGCCQSHAHLDLNIRRGYSQRVVHSNSMLPFYISAVFYYLQCY